MSQLISRLRKSQNREIVAKAKIKPQQSKHSDFHRALADYFYKELKKHKFNVSKKNDLVVHLALDRTTDDRYDSIVIDCLDGYFYLRGTNHKDKKIGKLMGFKGNRSSDAFHCMQNSIDKVLGKVDKYKMNIVISDLRGIQEKTAVEGIDTSTKDKTLFETDWISIISRDGYDFLHEKRCQGKIVAILPIRDGKDEGTIEFLLRKELCPAHSNELKLCSLTGGYDDSSITLEQTVIKELKEEAGYAIEESDLVSLGWVYNSKSSDTQVYLYTCDLTDVEQGEATTDGTELEKIASAEWGTLKDVLNTNDSYLLSILARIENK